MDPVDIEEAKLNLSDLIDAAINGEEIIIAKAEKHFVKRSRSLARNRARSSEVPKV